MGYFLGIDSSTTAAKALLMDADGRIIALGSSEYPCDTPRPGWSEQPAEAFWDVCLHHQSFIVMHCSFRLLFLR